MNLCYWYLMIYCHYVEFGPDKASDPMWVDFYKGILREITFHQNDPDDEESDGLYSYEYDYRGGHALSWKSFGTGKQSNWGKSVNVA